MCRVFRRGHSRAFPDCRALKCDSAKMKGGAAPKRAFNRMIGCPFAGLLRSRAVPKLKRRTCEQI